VISEKGYDSGVLDVGDGYVITAHIEINPIDNKPSSLIFESLLSTIGVKH